MDIRVKSFNKKLKKYIDNYLMFSGFEKSPITFVAYSVAFNTWFIIIGLALLMYKKKYNLIIPILIVPVIFLSVLFGPVMLLRYLYQDFVIIPLLLAFVFGNFNKNQEILSKQPSDSEILI